MREIESQGILSNLLDYSHPVKEVHQVGKLYFQIHTQQLVLFSRKMKWLDLPDRRVQ